MRSRISPPKKRSSQVGFSLKRPERIRFNEGLTQLISTGEMDLIMGIPKGLEPSPFQSRVNPALSENDFIAVNGQAVPLFLSDPEKEYEAIRSSAGMIDFSMLYKWEIVGANALDVANKVFSRDLTKVHPGSIAYGVIVNENGLMIDDCTVLLYKDGKVRITGANPENATIIRKYLGSEHTLTEVRSKIATLSLQGPKSRAILQKLTDTDVSNEAFPYYTFQLNVMVGGIPAHINRMGFTAELGYEIMVPVEQALKLWDCVLAAGEEFGVVECGAISVMMVRVEAGMIMAELEYDENTSPYECRMGWAVDLDKDSFHGKKALVGLKTQARSSIASIVIDSEADGLDGAQISAAGELVGAVTMAIPSPVLGGKTLALARLNKGFTSIGQELLAGGKQATVVATPVYDPERKRVRS
jgi:aminomethyltransferase